MDGHLCVDSHLFGQTATSADGYLLGQPSLRGRPSLSAVSSDASAANYDAILIAMELESGAIAAIEEPESPPRSQESQASAALQVAYARLVGNQSLQSQLGLTKSGIDLLEQMVVGDEESARAAQQVLESLVGQSDHDQRSQVDVSANQISLWNDSAQTMVMDACDFPLDHTPDAMDQLSHAPAGFISCPSWDWACDHCDYHASERDNARRWVDARPCGHCGQPMRTWRIRGSHCDIFKPDGSTASPREAKTQERGKQTREDINEEAKKTRKLTSSEMVHPQQAK